MGQIYSWMSLTGPNFRTFWCGPEVSVDVLMFWTGPNVPNPWVLSLVTAEGVEIEVSRSNHWNTFRHYFFILVPQKMKDIVEIVLFKLRRDFFCLLINVHLLSLLHCANRKLLALNTNMRKMLPSGAVKLAVTSQHVRLSKTLISTI